MIFVHTSIFLGLTSEVTTTVLQTTSDSCPVQTNSLALLGGLFEMGYFGAGLLFGQDADSIAPPTKSRNAPAQAMNTAAPNSYLQKGEKKEKKVKVLFDKQLYFTERQIRILYVQVTSTVCLCTFSGTHLVLTGVKGS